MSVHTTKEKRKMKYKIAVFKSRKEAIEFGGKMERQGVLVRAVNTPSRISSACGLSVKFKASALGVAERVLSAGDYFSFKGFYDE